jgi:hypothetical protein
LQIPAYTSLHAWGNHANLLITEATHQEVAPLHIHSTVIDHGFFRVLDDQSLIKTALELADHCEP